MTDPSQPLSQQLLLALEVNTYSTALLSLTLVLRREIRLMTQSVLLGQVRFEGRT
jgi:hypothetical protein